MKYILLSFALIFITKLTFADSPLTSTEFYNSYLDVSLVKEASQSKGIISSKMLEYLDDDKNPLDVKLAIINALGWNRKGNNNSKLFFNYVIKVKHYKSEIGSNYINFKWNATRDELICYAYLKALDNYFNIDDAFTIASEAKRKYPQFFSVNFIYNLIKAQAITSVGEYCFASKLFLVLKTKSNLEIDMRKEAFNDIFSYMIEIGKDCNLSK